MGFEPPRGDRGRGESGDLRSGHPSQWLVVGRLDLGIHRGKRGAVRVGRRALQRPSEDSRAAFAEGGGTERLQGFAALDAGRPTRIGEAFRLVGGSQ